MTALILIYLAVCAILGFIGRRTKLGFWGYFFGSIILSPILGLIILLVSDHHPPPEPTPLSARSRPRIIVDQRSGLGLLTCVVLSLATTLLVLALFYPILTAATGPTAAVLQLNFVEPYKAMILISTAMLIPVNVLVWRSYRRARAGQSTPTVSETAS
jgi:hypothetical protein